MRSLYESIMDDDETIISHARKSSLRFYVDPMLNSGKADKQLIRELESTVAIYPVTNDNISDIVTKYIKLAGDKCSLNWIDTSKVTSMRGLFSSSTNRFNGDISNWDVSNVKDMTYMFIGSDFNGNISDWDVSNVKNMIGMFKSSKFNRDISNWNVSSVEDMNSMFSYSKFNSDISNWNVSNVKNMSYMFYKSDFNQDISKWIISKTTRCENMFSMCPIKQEYKPIK